MCEIKLNTLTPCLEDVVDERDLNDIVFDMKLNDVFDDLMFAELTVKSSKDKKYKNGNYLLCKDCFLKLIEGEVL